MNNKAFILLGKSGSGKGTQAELLAQYLTNQGSDVHEIEMGEAFRDFLRESNYTAEQAQAIAHAGGLQPDFLANHFLAQEMIKYSNGSRNFIFDGTPRTKRQARVLDGALRFYSMEAPHVIYFDVPDEIVLERMQERNRSDDEQDTIKTRLEWFKRDTLRALEFFNEKNDYYRVTTIDATQSPEDIHQELIRELSL